MVCPSVPSHIAALPSATGIETFNRQRILHLLQGGPTLLPQSARVKQAKSGERASPTSTRQEACGQEQPGRGDRHCDRRPAELREELFVRCRAECARTSPS